MTSLLPFITALTLTCFCIPVIITVAHKKQLFDFPNNRSSHELPTPSLGGVAMMIGILISTLICSDEMFSGQFQYIICSLLVIFIVGLKDDLVGISPKKKLLGQAIAAIFLVVAGVRITDLHGFLGITELSLISSYILTILVFAFLSNAYNLIDGINGLSGSLLTIAAVCAGVWFYIANDYPFMIFSFSVAGAAVGFLKYNFSSKIFMGDCGSLVAGFAITILMIRFLETFTMVEQNFILAEGVLAIAFSIIFIPVFDTCRVFCVRIYNGKSPFSADRGHIHHILLDNGCSHIQATLILVVSQLIIIGFAYSFQAFGFVLVSLILIVFAAMFSSLLQERATQKQSTPIIRLPSVSSDQVVDYFQGKRA